MLLSELKIIVDFWGLITLIIVTVSILEIYIGIWIYRDAKKRKMDAAIWLLIFLLTTFIGLIIYFVVRDPLPTDEIKK